MPSIPKVLRIYNSPNNNIKGWGQSDLITNESLKTINDPLSAKGKQVNKPGSSIPSMFARMLFFQTAFISVKPSVIPSEYSMSVYNRLISECFDILELIYSHANDLHIRCWNKDKQIQKLKDNGNAILADALEQQCNDYLSDVTDIYLLYQDNLLIGATSPFTIAYTSPNWQRDLNKPVQSLLERNPKFREYMYSFAIAYQSEPNNAGLKSFITYILQCRNNDPIRELSQMADGRISINDFHARYPLHNFLIDGTERPVRICNTPNIYLNGRNVDTLASDFYIDSTLIPFNETTTPLVLYPGSYPGMHYYDDEAWPAGQSFNQVEGDNDDTTVRPLPGCTLYSHSFLSTINFLENKLLRIPYRMNEDNFKAAITLPDGTSCLLPLKPMFFKYFKCETLQNYFSYSIQNGKCTVKLVIPVRNNAGTTNHEIIITRVYDLVNDVIRTGTNDFDVSFNVGIFPFHKCTGKPELNKFIVASFLEDQDVEWEIGLQFYKHGFKTPLPPAACTQRNQHPSSRYYEVTDFDYLQIQYGRNAKGTILPDFAQKNVNGANQYYYAIDFGTTNTHIAFISHAQDTAESFRADQIKNQMVYLCSVKEETKESCGADNASLVLQANREFFPLFRDDSYSFPIRTVVGSKQALNAESRLFGDVSIGFHYSKEFITQNFYNTKLKWALEHNNPNQKVLTSIERLFTELLWMVKNHWMLRDDSNYNQYPIVMLTHPLVMTKWNTLFQLWQNAYAEVFGVTYEQAATYFKDMTESLAPCQSIIVKGSGVAGGMLNVDIGGGSTDFQYYRIIGNTTTSYYDSILFAGDDLWGKGFENLSTNIGAAITTNRFIQFAQSTLNDVAIQVGQEAKSVKEISITDPKEFVNILLRDRNNHLKNVLSNPEQNVCRKMMYIHYASIIYHISNWMIVNPVMSFPQTINFTGLGSKYIEMLFNTKTELTAFTKVLVEAFVGEQTPAGFEVHISDNPKNATAEGAALFAKQGTWPISEVQHHLGFDGDFAQVTLGNFPQYQEAIITYFDAFIDRFNNRPNCNMLQGQFDLRLTDAEVQTLKDNARQSLENVYAIKCTGVNNLHNTNIEESMFFWMLKDSLWKLQ